jgi:geranylgeranyl diphosphate synthase, type II
MIHTYSLIHDDLPAMDNVDFRRGKPTSHKVFGEAAAVLAGDALLNFAFETMLLHTSSLKTLPAISGRLKAMEIIAAAAGVSGMIGGQVVDLESENSIISENTLLYMHKCKTGALIKAPVLAAASICFADNRLKSALEQYSEKIGLIFQIKDDILDIEGNSDIMGKSTGSDISNNKATFITQYGLDRSKKMMYELTAEAINCIEEYGERAYFLMDLAQYIINRAE